jgi:hypothetical protein
LCLGGCDVPSVLWDQVGSGGVSRESSDGCGSLADLERWEFHQWRMSADLGLPCWVERLNLRPAIFLGEG